MIYPILRGILGFAQVPITWILVALNVFVFVWNYDENQKNDLAHSEIVKQEEFWKTTGQLYSKYISVKKQPKEQQIEHHLQPQVLGFVAFRDRSFIDYLDFISGVSKDGAISQINMDLVGDAVALKKWKEQYIKFKNIEDESPIRSWGLTAENWDLVHLITYQFTHSGFFHLLWNMLILLLFGAVIELELGGFVLLFTYVLTGISGAYLFRFLIEETHSPLVGASGAISGLVAAYMMWKGFSYRAKYIFWLLPFEGYYGITRLPVGLFVILFFLPDLAGQIASSSLGESLAYGAHIGGFMGGAILGRVYLLLFKNNRTQLKLPSSDQPLT